MAAPIVRKFAKGTVIASGAGAGGAATTADAATCQPVQVDEIVAVSQAQLNPYPDFKPSK